MLEDGFRRHGKAKSQHSRVSYKVEKVEYVAISGFFFFSLFVVYY